MAFESLSIASVFLFAWLLQRGFGYAIRCWRCLRCAAGLDRNNTVQPARPVCANRQLTLFDWLGLNRVGLLWLIFSAVTGCSVA